jgi:hypothetical protein
MTDINVIEEQPEVATINIKEERKKVFEASCKLRTGSFYSHDGMNNLDRQWLRGQLKGEYGKARSYETTVFSNGLLIVLRTK